MGERTKKESNVPNLRFKEFEGEWESKTINELGNFLGGGTPSSVNSNFWNGEIPWISSSDLDENDIHTVRITRFINEEAIRNSSTKLCIAPVILIVSRVGVGKVAYSTKSLCTSQDFTNIVNLKCNGSFLSYLLSVVMRKAGSNTQGTSIKGIPSNEIKSKTVYIPEDGEQQKIASFLSLLDDRISTQSKIITQLETLMQGLNEQLLNQQIRFKDDNRNDFPDWKEKRIGEILSIGNGKDYRHLASGKIPVFGTGGLMTHVDSFLYDGETVCIGRKGTIDNPMYFEGKIWTVDTLFYTHSFIDVIPKFIFFVFKSINWKEHNEASGVPSLSKSTLERIIITLPSVEEQFLITGLLTTIDERIDIEKEILEQYQNQKKYLLQNMFI